MTRLKPLLTASAAFIAVAGMANAQEVVLTAAEQSVVSNACEIGLPLIPVESDFGYETGQYALPITEAGGEVNSALILSEDSLRSIPECRAEIDHLVAERRADESTVATS